MIINNSEDKATIEEGLQQDSGYPYEKRPDKRPLLYFFIIIQRSVLVGYLSFLHFFQFFYRSYRIRRTENKATGNQHIGTGFQQTLPGFQIHTTVHFY